VRILWVASKLETGWSGGVGRVLRGGCEALAAAGHEVHLAGVRPREGEPGALGGVTLHPFAPVRWKFQQLGPLRALVRRLAPDVVHFHSALPHGAVVVPLLLLRSGAATPLVVVTPHTGARSDYPKRLARLALRRADGVLCPSRWSAERAQRAGAPSTRVRVIHNGFDAPARPADPPAREPVVCFLGRLVRSKGPDVLLEAFARAAEGHPAWRLVLAGEGREADALRARAAGLPCAARVSLPGQVVGEAKSRLLASAGIGCVPSRDDNLPGSLLELQASGVPTIASAVGGIPELAEDGAAARLVPPEDADALAAALDALMKDEGERARLGAAALAASADRTWKRYAERTLAVYRELAQLRRTA
jgi:glycosyltransferase involved in cell wall biosynthesis